jgi:hypothetical protein
MAFENDGFAPETKIVMADGRYKSMLNLRSGDSILCIDADGNTYIRNVFTIEKKVGLYVEIVPSDGFGNTAKVGLNTPLYLVEKSKPKIRKVKSGWSVKWYENGGPCIKYFKGSDLAVEHTAKYFFDTTKRSVTSVRKITVRNFLNLDPKYRNRLRGCRGKSFKELEDRKVPQDPFEYGKNVGELHALSGTSSIGCSSGESAIATIGSSYTFNSIRIRYEVISGVLSVLPIKKRRGAMVVKCVENIAYELCSLMRSIGIFCCIESNEKIKVCRKSYDATSSIFSTPKIENKKVARVRCEKSTFKFKVEVSDTSILYRPLLGGECNFLLDDYTIY